MFCQRLQTEGLEFKRNLWVQGCRGHRPGLSLYITLHGSSHKFQTLHPYTIHTFERRTVRTHPRPSDSPVTEPIKLEIDPDIPRPPPATKCRSVPLHWQESLDKLLDSLIANGVIVPHEGATDFVAPSFLVAKLHDPSRGRLVQDYLDGVNNCLKRSAHPIPSQFQVWQKVHPASTCFFSAYLAASYFQIPITEESQPLTTFLTPRGKFMMIWLSMGLSASSDQFNQRVGGVLENFPNLSVMREINDLLGHATGLDQLNKELELLLKICRQHSLTLSPKSLLWPRKTPISFLLGIRYHPAAANQTQRGCLQFPSFLVLRQGNNCRASSGWSHNFTAGHQMSPPPPVT